MTPLGAALRKKFKTPDEAMQTLGLDAALLNASAGALDGDTASGDNLMANRATRRAAASQARGTSRLAEDKKAHDEEVENKKEACDESEEEEKKKEEAEDEEESDEEKRKEDENRAAEDEEEDKDEEEKKKDEHMTKSAMDAAIAKTVNARVTAEIDRAVSVATKKLQENFRAVRDAEIEVAPYVGKLAMSFDSAENVRRAALDVLGVDHDGVHPSALSAILKAQPLPGQVAQQHKSTAQRRRKAAEEFSAMFPDLPPNRVL